MNYTREYVHKTRRTATQNIVEFTDHSPWKTRTLPQEATRPGLLRASSLQRRRGQRRTPSPGMFA